jgi:hypothetical protein
MNKRQFEQLEKKNARIEKRYAKQLEKMAEQGKRRTRKIERLLNRKAQRDVERELKIQKNRKEALSHQQKIQANREKKELERTLGIIPPIKRKAKKHYSEFQGFFYNHKRQKYRVQFYYKGKRYALGEYETAEIAHNVYLVERANKVAEYENSLHLSTLHD